MKKKNLFLGVLLASAVFSLAACNNKANNTESGEKTTESPTPTGDTPTESTTGETTPTGQEDPKQDLKVVSLSVNTFDAQVFYTTENLTTEGIVVTATMEDGETRVLDKEEYKVTHNFVKKTVGDYQVTISVGDVSTSYTVYVRDEDYSDYKAITNVEEFNNFRYLESSSKKFMLMSDIDLEGVALDATKVAFSGTFDGQGHTIKNASYIEKAENKTGFLTATCNNATITNIKFLNVASSAANETEAIVAGMVSGTCEFSKLEFNSCFVKATSYPGLIFGRSNAEPGVYTIKEITVKNGTYSEGGSSYGGLLIGDLQGGADATLKVSDIDVSAAFKVSTKNGGFLLGRVRDGSNVEVNNVIIRDADMPSGNNNGLITGGTKKLTKLSINNVVILNATNYYDLVTSTAENLSIQNIYTTNSSIVADSGSGYGKTALTAVASTDYNPTWLEGKGFDFENVWTKEGTEQDKYRLTSASTNVKNADSVITSIKLLTSNVTNRFHQGDAFTSDGLAVMAVYNDGVQIILNSSEFDVNYSEYDATKEGEYTITVSSKETNASGTTVSETYKVKVVSQTGFEVNSEFAVKTYLVDSDISTKNVLVYSVWSDGIVENIKESDYAKYGITITNNCSDTTVAGEYTVTITGKDQYSGLEFDDVTYKVAIVETTPEVVEDYVYVNVDASLTAADGTLVNGVETFKSLTAAVDYLAACNYDKSVNKVIYLASGVYYGKVTIPASLNNLSIIGEDWNNTIITYSAVEDTIDVTKGTAYGLDCATLHVNASNFGLYNVAVFNEFDYIKDASKYGSPQGLALTINGDMATVSHVHLYGNQDTVYLKQGRTYFDDCIIEGNIDFIFGNAKGLAFFDKCLINAVDKFGEKKDTNNGYVTAMKATDSDKPDYGYIFNACAFTADGDYTTATVPTEGVAKYYTLTYNFGDSKFDVLDGAMSLGRTWGAKATVSYINCSFTKAYSTAAYDGSTKSRWFKMNGEPTAADFSEYGSTGEGSITTAVVGGRILTQAEAANYTIANIFALNNGLIEWTATYDYVSALTTLKGINQKTAATAINVSEDSFTIERNKKAEIKVTVAPWNAENKEVTYEIGDSSIVSFDGKTITALKEGTTTITFKLGSLEKVVTVEVTAPTGKSVIKFMDGETELTDLQITGVAGDALTLPTAPTKDKYKFIGYYEDADFSKKFTKTELPEEDTVLYLYYMELEKENVEYVSTADALVAAIAANKVIYLTANIDMSTATTPYTGRADNFTGSVYGYDFEIQNWSLEGVTTDSISFFGKTYGGVLKNIVFSNCTITTNAKYTSILTSGSYASEVIENITFNKCYVKNSADAAANTYSSLVAGAGNLGSHGGVDDLTVKNITCIDSYVSGSQYSGGIFGYCNKGNIILDGLFGDITFNSVGSNCKNSGAIIGWAKNYSFTLKNADATLKVNGIAGSSSNLGGVVGGLQYDSAATGAVISKSKLNIIMKDVNKVAGGIVAIQYATATLEVKDSDITFNIEGAGESLAGIAGRAAGSTTITNVTLSGTINGQYRTAAIAGYINAATATATLTDVTISSLSIINSSTDASGNTVYGKSDATTAIDVTGVSFNSDNISINLGGTVLTADKLQGTDTKQ